MDPNRTLEELLSALRDNDREGAYEALESLLDWLSRGGFLPSPPPAGKLIGLFPQGFSPEVD